jgi:hypothetical protein
MLAAAFRGDLEMIGKCVFSGEDAAATCNVADAMGNTALHFAAQGGYAEAVAALLANGAQVNATNRQNQTPLHVAANRDVVNQLLAHGADTSVKAELSLPPPPAAATAPGGVEAEDEPPPTPAGVPGGGELGLSGEEEPLRESWTAAEVLQIRQGGVDARGGGGGGTTVGGRRRRRGGGSAAARSVRASWAPGGTPTSGARRRGFGGGAGSVAAVRRAFPSWNRSILTEIYLCRARSCHEVEDGNARTGAPQLGRGWRGAHALRRGGPRQLCAGRLDGAGGAENGARAAAARRRPAQARDRGRAVLRRVPVRRPLLVPPPRPLPLGRKPPSPPPPRVAWLTHIVRRNAERSRIAEAEATAAEPEPEPEEPEKFYVSPFLLWVGSRCLGHCVHGAPIAALRSPWRCRCAWPRKTWTIRPTRARR